MVESVLSLASNDEVGVNVGDDGEAHFELLQGTFEV